MTHELYAQAIAEISRLLQDARNRGVPDASAAALATATPDGRPSVRTVGIARVAPSGLAFFAKAASGKGRQLSANPRAAICFHWRVLSFQVIVEGSVLRLPDDEADALWAKAPRDYALGHWASDQNITQEPSALRDDARKFSHRFSEERVPRPSTWLAYELHPDRIDIWQTGWHRLHPHRQYLREADGTWSQAKRNP